MKKIIFIIVLLQQVSLYGQQLPLFLQYRDNAGVINPATINSDFNLYNYNLSAGATYRHQWDKRNDTPRTQTLRIEYLSKDKLILGAYLINDQTGPTGFSGMTGRLGYLITDDSNKAGLSLGLNFGLMQYQIDGTEIDFIEEGDINDMKFTQLYPDFGFGIYGYFHLNGGFFNEDLVYGGFSVPQTFGLNLNIKEGDGFDFTRVRHYYAQLGFRHFTELDAFSFWEPSIWMRTISFQHIQVDLNIRRHFSNKFWVGVGGSLNKTLHLESGVVLSNILKEKKKDYYLKIGYGFDANFTEYRNPFGNTHELNIIYAFETK